MFSPSIFRRSSIVNHLKEQISLCSQSSLSHLSALRKDDTTILSSVTPAKAIGGMRDIPGMLTETSHLDAINGIEYRGYSLYECNDLLPKAAPSGSVGLPEASLWLLLTGKIPSTEETTALNEELHRRGKELLRSSEDLEFISNLAKSSKKPHPMTQLSSALLHLQPNSLFANKYRNGELTKKTYWEYALEDSLTIIAQIPIIASLIYRSTFFKEQSAVTVSRYNESLDWAGNYADLLNVSTDEQFREVTRLYLMLHADHEGGNVSAHATHLVGSALSDPYLSLTAGVCGLAGPLHGLANQECLRWLETTMTALNGAEPTVENITEYAKATLASGQVIPGFGHAVLRKTDPRYMLERDFALKHMSSDPMVKLVDVCFRAIPPVLEATGKVKNPYPNVDAHSGVCMKHYGLSQADYYTVVFAVSRSLGVLSQLVTSRALGLPIERPKSITTDWIKSKMQ